MSSDSYVQVPPDSTGKQLGTWTDPDGRHYHGQVLVDPDGNPIHYELVLIRRNLEELTGLLRDFLEAQ